MDPASGYTYPNDYRYRREDPFYDPLSSECFNLDIKPVPQPDEDFDPYYESALNENLLYDQINSLSDFDTLQQSSRDPVYASLLENDDDFRSLEALAISQANQPQPKRHSRNPSGSAIFGFAGSMHNKQLSIPGLNPMPLSSLKRPQLSTYRDPSPYQDVTTPKKQILHRDEDFVVTGKTPHSYKFPASPPPQSTATVNNFSAEYLMNLRRFAKENVPVTEANFNDFLSNKKPQFFDPSADLSQPVLHKPYTPQSFPFVNEPVHQPPPEQINYYHPGQPLNPPVEHSGRMPELSRSYSHSSTHSDSSSDNAVIASSPKQARVVHESAKKNNDDSIIWTPVLVSKKDKAIEDIIRSQTQSPTRKGSTLKTTLPRGFIDQYFVGPNDEKRFTCVFDNCGKTFGRISNVRTHIQTHLCDRPFACHECGKSFVRQHDLRRHQKNHQEFSFQCPCGKKFSRQDALKRHRIRQICVGGMVDDRGISKPGPSQAYRAHSIEEALRRKLEADGQLKRNNFFYDFGD